MDDKEQIAQASLPKPARKRKAKAKSPAKPGRKTLIAAVAACIVAATDLFMTLRYGLKLF